MPGLIRTALLTTALLAGSVAWAQNAPAVTTPVTTPEKATREQPTTTGGAPTGFVAPAEPKADESAAARAQTQPGNNAPVWRGVRDSGSQPGYASLPGAEQGMLIQPFVQYPGSRLTNAGEAWREVRNRWILPYGGSFLLIVALAIAIFYWTKGPLGQPVRDTGRKVERFTPFERAAHWANAGAFVALAVSGLVMAFGKFVLLPVIGSTLFGWLTWLLKTMHNFVGPLFAVSLVIVIVTFVKDNIANKADFVWLSKAGGMLGDHEIPSHRFNAGEKGIFWWGVTIPGLIIVASGLVLDQLLRIGKQAFVSFPNFAQWKIRFAHMFGGRMPVTKQLPHRWYDTPNIHHVTIDDFKSFVKERGYTIEGEWYLTGEKQRGPGMANLLAEHAVFLLRR